MATLSDHLLIFLSSDAELKKTKKTSKVTLEDSYFKQK